MLLLLVKSTLNITARREDAGNGGLNEESVSSNFPLTFTKFKYGTLLISIHTNNKNISKIIYKTIGQKSIKLQKKKNRKITKITG